MMIPYSEINDLYLYLTMLVPLKMCTGLMGFCDRSLETTVYKHSLAYKWAETDFSKAGNGFMKPCTLRNLELATSLLGKLPIEIGKLSIMTDKIKH